MEIKVVSSPPVRGNTTGPIRQAADAAKGEWVEFGPVSLNVLNTVRQYAAYTGRGKYEFSQRTVTNEAGQRERYGYLRALT